MQSGFSLAPCSPLRRLRAYSAELVRAPPYIKVERENCPPDAIRRYSHRCIGRARHKLKRARQLHRIYPASVLAAYTPGERRFPAHGAMRRSRAVPYSTLQTLGRARQLRHIYPASAFALSTLGERRLSTRGGMRCCRGIPYSAFRISNSAFPLPFSTKKGGASPSRLFLLSADYYLSSFLYSARSFTAASCLPVFSRRSR